MGGWEAWWRQQARHARRPLCIMRLSPFIGWRPFRQTSCVFLRFALLTDFKTSAAEESPFMPSPFHSRSEPHLSRMGPERGCVDQADRTDPAACRYRQDEEIHLHHGVT